MASRLVTSTVCCVLIVLAEASWPVAFAQTGHFPQVVQNSSGMKDFVDITSKTITALATILAGAWAYYRFVKGRVFKSRLTVSISGRQVHIGDMKYILSVIEISNVGLARVDFYNPNIRINALSGKAVQDSVSLPNYNWLRTVPVLTAHTFIESGERLTEQYLFVVDVKFPIIIDLKLTILERRLFNLLKFRSMEQKVSFRNTTIVEP